MPLVKSIGIILRSKKYSETSLILDVYTKEFGLKSLIISGVRKSRSKSKVGIYQVMNIIDVVFFDNQKETLSRIKEARISVNYKEISRNVIKSSIGMLMTEISRNAIKEKESNETLFDFLIDWFVWLDGTQKGLGNIPIKYLLALSQHLGFYPIDNYSNELCIFDTYEAQFVGNDRSNKYCVSPEISINIHQLLQIDRSELNELKLNRHQRAQILDKLIQFYQLHIENFRDLKSISILRQVLS